MRVAIAILIAAHAGFSFGKLPPPTEQATAQAKEAANKAAWADKVALYKTCAVQDRLAEQFRKNQKASGKEAPAPTPTPQCIDPGPYLALEITPVESKPLEAAGAHSPPGLAVSPPSTNQPQSEKAQKR